MPQFINAADAAVTEAVQGGCLTNPDARVLCPTRYPTVVVSKHVSSENVALLCGGGSGHEPAHAGFVGEGCLSGAVCGRVFASPPISHISAALDYLLGGKYGAPATAPAVLVLVKNYTGDVINFGAAVEAARIRYGADKVDMIVFGDDVAFGANHDARRGIAGTVLWYRMVGRLAAKAVPLPVVTEFASRCASAVRSMGASVSGCVLPGSESPNTTVAQGQVELGLGIHGEHGRTTVAFEGVESLTRQLLGHILNPVAPATPVAGFKSGVLSNREASWTPSVCGHATKVVIAINNLGGCSELEMSVLTRNAVAALSEVRDLVVSAVGCGSFCTSLNMHGFSFTAVSISGLFADIQSSSLLATILPTEESILDLLVLGTGLLAHKPTIVPYFPTDLTLPNPLTEVVPVISVELATQIKDSAEPGDRVGPLAAAIRSLLIAIAAKEAEYNAFDAATGDGDTGTGVRRAVEELLLSPTTVQCLAECLVASRPTHIAAVFAAIGESVCDTFAGSMGALLSTFITACGDSIASHCQQGAAIDSLTKDAKTLRAVLQAGISAVQRVGGADVGDRTFLDVLFPIVALLDSPPPVSGIAKAAEEAAALAAQLPAKKGRARYLGGKEVGCRDPGCELVKDIIIGIYGSQ